MDEPSQLDPETRAVIAAKFRQRLKDHGLTLPTVKASALEDEFIDFVVEKNFGDIQSTTDILLHWLDAYLWDLR